jgi:Haem-NO-binding
MYGMVNRAIEEMVTENFGEATWEQIKTAAGVDVEMFISNEGYPDDLTYRLVAAAAQILEMPAEDVLEAFGIYWILHTATEGYGDLMDAGGHSLGEFLGNLPGFHARVALIYPNLKPPTFRTTDVKPTSLHLHYFSSRPGLQPFVIGLVKGLAKKYDSAVQITTLRSRETGADHEEFLVEWSRTGEEAKSAVGDASA